MKFNNDTQNCDVWRSYFLLGRLLLYSCARFFFGCNYYSSERLSKAKNTFHLPSWEPVHIPSQKHFWVDDCPFSKGGSHGFVPCWGKLVAGIKGDSRDPQGHGTPENGKLDPYHSHIFRDCYRNSMGPAYHFRGSHVLIPLKVTSTTFEGVWPATSKSPGIIWVSTHMIRAGRDHPPKSSHLFIGFSLIFTIHFLGYR